MKLKTYFCCVMSLFFACTAGCVTGPFVPHEGMTINEVRAVEFIDCGGLIKLSPLHQYDIQSSGSHHQISEVEVFNLQVRQKNKLSDGTVLGTCDKKLYFKGGKLISESTLDALIQKRKQLDSEKNKLTETKITTPKLDDTLLKLQQSHSEFIRLNNLILEEESKNTKPHEFQVYRSPSGKLYYSKGYKFFSGDEEKDYEAKSACIRNATKLKGENLQYWKVEYCEQNQGQGEPIYEWLVKSCNIPSCRGSANRFIQSEMSRINEEKTKADRQRKQEQHLLSQGNVAIKIDSSYTKCFVAEDFVCYLPDFEDTINAKIQNNLDKTIKDIVIICKSLAESGTILSKDKNVIYKLFPPKQTIDVQFTLPQVKQRSKVSCTVDRWGY
jgi:hypothetical protein